MKRLKGICTPQGRILIHTSYPPPPPCPPAFYQVPWQVAGTQVFSWAKGHTSSSGWVCSAFHDRFHPCLSVINSIWKFFNPTFCIIHKIVDLCSLWAPWCLSVMSWIFVVVPSVKVRVFPENTSCNVAARSQRWISQPWVQCNEATMLIWWYLIKNLYVISH